LAISYRTRYAFTSIISAACFTVT
jgi:hypothetical protein